MNVYDIDQTTLSNDIKELLNETYYIEAKILLNEILDSLDNNSNNNNEKDDNNNRNKNNYKEFIKIIISLIKSPYELLDQSAQNSFLKSPSLSHSIFNPIITHRKYLNGIVRNINNAIVVEKIYQIYIKYFESLELFKKNICEAATPSILKSPAIVFTEDLNQYQVKSLELSYDIISYNPVEHEYQKRNKSRNIYGSVINREIKNSSLIDNSKLYFKVDRGDRSLKPIKEYAVYQLYKLLYPLSKSTIVSPTQLLVLDQLEVLSPHYQLSETKELDRLKAVYGTPPYIKIVLEKEQEYKKRLESALQNSDKIFVQASLFIKGITLEEYLKQCKINNDINYSQIDLESFSSHILSTLLLYQTDYKANGLILQDGTNKIIGIDNDEVLGSLEILKSSNNDDYYPNIKNILFTLAPLMSNSIHQNAKDQFIQHTPSVFILKWLLILEKKNLNYYSLISKLFITQTDENDKKKTISRIKESLNLRIQFTKDWILEMYQRFKSIKRLLLQNPKISHQELLNEIIPLTSVYYQLLSTIDSNPLGQISLIHELKYSYKELLNSSKNLPNNILNIENQIKKSNLSVKGIDCSIRDSIKELVQVTDYNDLVECKVCSNSRECISNRCENSNKTKSIIFEWLELVFSINGSNNFEFHKSWYEKKESIFKILLIYEAPCLIISNFVKSFKITLNNNNYISIINQSDIIYNNNIQNQVEFLVNDLNLDIEAFQDNHTLLDLASINNNLNLFIRLVDMGAGRKANLSIVYRFYQNLSNEKKSLLEPYLSKLFLINPKINWEISLNQLFPLLDSINSNKIKNNGTNNPHLLLFQVKNSTKRIISNEIYNQLFDESTGEPKKSNILIKDDFGNGIYIKFKPQSPGTEIAVHNLCEQLFNSNLTPYCELFSINNIPVLLIQQIPGEPLTKFLQINGIDIMKNVIIDKSNISKYLVMSILTNNSNGDLSNLFLVHNKIKDNYLLYSIENGQCFIPSNSSDTQKLLQVEKVLYLFNLINDTIHQDVINSVKNLNYYSLLKSWLLNLQQHHQLSLDHFKSTQEQLEKDREAIIGVSFNKVIVIQLFSKIKHLKYLFKKDKSTHLEIFESIEPLVYNRYKEKYLFQPKAISHSSDTQDQLWSEGYCPKQLLEQLDLFYKQFNILKESNESTFQNYIRLNQIVPHYSLELLLNEYFNNNNSILNDDLKDIMMQPTQKLVFDCIKYQDLSVVNLKNCLGVDIGIIMQLKLDYIVKLDLSGCSRIINFEGLKSRKLYFKSLIKIRFNSCIKLESIRIESPNLQVISAQHCRSLKVLEIDSLNNFYCNLIGTLSTQNIHILKCDLYYNNKLEYLNISESNLGEEVTISQGSLKYLAMNSMGPLRKINLEVPVIESFSIEGCHSLNEISTIRNDQVINNNLWNILMSKDINYFKANNISINMAAAKQIYNQNKFNDFIMFVPNDSAFLIPPNTTCRFYYKVPTNFTFKSSIPKNILSLSISGDLPQQLYEEKLPNSIKYLQLYDTKMVNTNDLKLEYLFLGYGIKNQINIGFDIHLSTSSNSEVIHPLYYLPPDKVIKEYSFKIESENLVSFIFFYNTQQLLLSNPLPPDNINLESSNYFKRIIFDLCSVPKHLVIYNFNNGYIFNDNSAGKFRSVLLKDFDKDDSIPNSNNSVYLDLKLLYEVFSISSLKPPVNLLQCLNGYNQPIISGTISSTITSLYLREVNYPLSIGSIPTSVTHLELCDGFNQEITKEGIIPNSVRYLFVGNIKYSLNKNSIPKELELLELGINFKFDSLSSGVIPTALQKLIIFNEFNLEINKIREMFSICSLTRIFVYSK